MVNNINVSPLIVEGVPRSGTRFFCSYIEIQFNIKIFRIQNEIAYYTDLLNKTNTFTNSTILSFKKLTSEYNFKNRVGIVYDVDQILSKFKGYKLSYILGIILKEKAFENGYKHWGLKFDYFKGMNTVCNLYTNSKYIHLIRDGRDVHLSACNCLNEGYHNALHNSKFWKYIVEERIKFGKTIDNQNFINIYYEDLVSNPEKIYSDLSIFLDIKDGSYNMMNVKSRNIYKWQQNMPQKDIQIYESISGELLKELGYLLGSNAPIRLNSLIIIKYNAIECLLKLKQYLVKFFDKKERYKVIRKIRLKIVRSLRKFCHQNTLN